MISWQRTMEKQEQAHFAVLFRQPSSCTKCSAILKNNSQSSILIAGSFTFNNDGMCFFKSRQSYGSDWYFLKQIGFRYCAIAFGEVLAITNLNARVDFCCSPKLSSD